MGLTEGLIFFILIFVIPPLFIIGDDSMWPRKKK